jgi:hypothetical protein
MVDILKPLTEAILLSPSSQYAKIRFQNSTDLQIIKVTCSLLGILRVSETGRSFSDKFLHTTNRNGSSSVSYLGIKGRVNP